MLVYYPHVNENGLVLVNQERFSNDAIQTSQESSGIIVEKYLFNGKTFDLTQLMAIFSCRKLLVMVMRYGLTGQVDPTDGVNFSGRFASNNLGGFDIFWERGVYPNVDILFRRFGSMVVH